MIFLLFLLLLVERYALDCSTPPYCNGHGSCVTGNTLCTCHSGYYGAECQYGYWCPTPKTAVPLDTDFVPVLLPSSRIEADQLKLRFESPIVTNRYDYHIKIGNPNGAYGGVCDSWIGTLWWQYPWGCNMRHRANLDWADVENDCGWDNSLSTSAMHIFKNTIHFDAMEDFGIIQRFISWEYEITIKIPQCRLVEIVNITINAPVEIIAVMYFQDVFPKINSAKMKLFTQVEFPYKLTFLAVVEEPVGIDSSVTPLPWTCLSGSGPCSQAWLNTLNLHGCAGGLAVGTQTFFDDFENPVHSATLWPSMASSYGYITGMCGAYSGRNAMRISSSSRFRSPVPRWVETKTFSVAGDVTATVTFKMRTRDRFQSAFFGCEYSDLPLEGLYLVLKRVGHYDKVLWYQSHPYPGDPNPGDQDSTWNGNYAVTFDVGSDFRLQWMQNVSSGVKYDDFVIDDVNITYTGHHGNPIQICEISGTYKYAFHLGCRPGYPACPYDEVVYITTEIISEDFCDVLMLSTNLNAYMVACADAPCTTLTSAFLTTGTAYFQIFVDSPELTIVIAHVCAVWLVHDNGTIYHMYINHAATALGVASNFLTTPAPDPFFQFDTLHLPPGIYTVHAKVCVDYLYEFRRDGDTETYDLYVEKELRVGEAGVGDDDEKEDGAGGLKVLDSLMMLAMF